MLFIERYYCFKHSHTYIPAHKRSPKQAQQLIEKLIPVCGCMCIQMQLLVFELVGTSDFHSCH